MAKLKEIYEIINEFAPFSTQLEYDNSGIILGDADTDITGIMVTLDTTMGVIFEAKERGCNLIIEHHPSIWGGIKRIDYSYPLCQILANAIKFDISIISVHTNFDFAEGGLNDYVASKIGLENIRNLDTQYSARIGELKKPVTMHELAISIGDKFNEKNVLTIGNENKLIKKAAVINGGGGGDAESIINTMKAGCDIFITSDVKHSVARLAKDLNYGIIEISHHACEACFADLMAGILKKQIKDISVLSTSVLENPYN